MAFGSYFFLNDSLPVSKGDTSIDGTFDTTSAGALNSTKLEDVDTSPSDPTRAVLGDQDSGLFTFDFDFVFSGGSFNAAASGFSITKVQNHVNDVDYSGSGAYANAFGDADNVDWTAPTVINGSTYAEGLIFVNEDSGTANGEIWMNAPDGSNLILIGDTVGISGAAETSGILDISQLVGYNPGSIVLTSNQGSNASLSVLINPYAQRDNADFNGDNDVDGFDFLTWQRNLGSGTLPVQGDAQHDGDVDGPDFKVWEQQFGSPPPLFAAAAVPEPSAACLLSLALYSFVGIARLPNEAARNSGTIIARQGLRK